MYNSKLKYPKWQLSTGKIVEDTMHAFAKECLYEHSSLSLILDISDPCWKAHFTPAELVELRTYHKPELKPLPNELKEYLDKFSGVYDLNKLIDIHMQNRFHPSQADLHWVEKTIGDILDLYYYSYDVDNKTEADLVRRLWGFIEKCYDESKFYVISGEKVSVSSSNRMNEDRSVPGATPLTRKKTGTKVDILIKHLYDDFGVGEAGLSGGAVSTKYITEASIKLPKSLKDVLWNLLKMATKDTQQLCVPGFIINGTELTVKLMDIPSGNACRVYTLGPMPFPLIPETFFKNFIPLVTLVWQCKTLLKETLQCLNTDNNIFIPTIDDPIPTSTIPPCIPSPKKRKISGADTD
ncbi:hypothetical protein BDB00DRAFT_846706 [Zychaea mexicana]|uniref:uncharacterized protein n=1 Tax=Zychaea mexicana TaxID=64656 RepID=UPI0022FE0DF1|nr:uncharacterized protein BDB00DRAFT_846706 [Zychaea mexicana]KAI9488816.1 hypothetical protein BDB00DRAFT_846706 [Zychaea mexicana]